MSSSSAIARAARIASRRSASRRYPRVAVEARRPTRGGSPRVRPRRRPGPARGLRCADCRWWRRCGRRGSATASAINGRFARSRSPPHPNTTIRRPSAQGLAAWRGACRRRRGYGRSRRSPGGRSGPRCARCVPGTWGQLSDAGGDRVDRTAPAPTPIPTATSRFSRLKSPSSGSVSSVSPPGVAMRARLASRLDGRPRPGAPRHRGPRRATRGALALRASRAASTK